MTNYKLNGEYVAIKNVTGMAHSLTGYVVSDRDGHRHAVGTFSLGAGKTAYLHTGSGPAGSTHRYWGSSYYIWTNTGDSATLRNQYGTYVDSCAYTAASDPVKTC